MERRGLHLVGDRAVLARPVDPGPAGRPAPAVLLLAAQALDRARRPVRGRAARPIHPVRRRDGPGRVPGRAHAGRRARRGLDRGGGRPPVRALAAAPALRAGGPALRRPDVRRQPRLRGRPLARAAPRPGAAAPPRLGSRRGGGRALGAPGLAGARRRHRAGAVVPQSRRLPARRARPRPCWLGSPATCGGTGPPSPTWRSPAPSCCWPGRPGGRGSSGRRGTSARRGTSPSRPGRASSRCSPRCSGSATRSRRASSRPASPPPWSASSPQAGEWG